MIFTGGQRKRNVDATITKCVFTRYRFEWLGSMGFRTGVDSGEQRGGWRTGRDLNDARAANERGRTVEEREGSRSAGGARSVQRRECVEERKEKESSKGEKQRRETKRKGSKQTNRQTVKSG